MKKIVVWIALLGICQSVWAQNLHITQNSYQKIAVTFTTGKLSADEISVPEGDFSLISLPGCGSSYRPGTPQLPQLTKMLQIPVCDSVVVTVLNAQYTDYDAAALGIQHPIFPTQPSLSKKDVRPEFVYDQQIYGEDSFFHFPLVQVEKAGIRRDVALANVSVSPVQYNPVTRKVRVYTRFDVEFTFVNADMGRTLALRKFSSPLFSSDEDNVINKMEGMRDEYSGAPVKYLIIGNSMFASNEDLAAFVAWKRRLGYLVEVAYTNDANVGTTTTSIKNFIQGKYDNATLDDPAPTYLLFLGDRAQLPAFTGQTDDSHITDLYYATLSGNDYLPDCYYGRLSATNNQELSNQIEKILMYEQYSMPDPSYLGNAVLIAGSDNYWSPTHANGQVHYINGNYINNDNPHYTNVMPHLYNCSSQAATIRSEINAGVGLANYTAHGSETSWADPTFNVNQVYAMNNTDKYGLWIGNCCVTGKFQYGECFAEAVLRAEKKGGMGYVGASNNSYWNEDFYWAVGVRSNITANPVYMSHNLGMYDKLFHTHNENHSVWVSTIGGIVTAGNMAVQSSSSEMKQYYWEIYHCFGDPSVRVYLGIPTEMPVTASSVIVVGASQYEVQADPYAYVALTHNGALVAAGFADANGHASLTLPASLEPGDCELVVMGQNRIVYFQSVQVIVPNGPYVIPTAVEVAENTSFNQGNTVRMNLSLANVGVSGASQVYATLTPDQPVTMLQDSVFVGTMSVDATENRANAFAFVMPAAEDYENLPFTLKIHWADTTVSRAVRVLVKLPNVTMKEYKTRINHAEVQSYNAGDEVDFVITAQNVGHQAVSGCSVDLTCNYSGVSVLTPVAHLDGLEPNASSVKTFTVKIADTVPPASIVSLYYHIMYDNVHRVDTLNMLVGGNFETFESGDFSQYAWTMGSNPWVVTNAQHYAGNYSARSAMNLPGNSSSDMTITTTTTEASTISYYRKVSSEENYDKFSFSIDGTKVDEASGEVDWTYFSTEVPAGTHTFRFSYSKDYSYDDGSDCAWLDNISLPTVGILVVEDVEDNVSVADHAIAYAKVYPNPANDYVVIESETPAGRVALFDLNGRMVKSGNADGGNRYLLNMGDVAPGFYLLQITFSDNRTQNLKIIKR